MKVTDIETLNSIHCVADALVNNMSNVTTEDDEHLCQMRGLICALKKLEETIG